MIPAMMIEDPGEFVLFIFMLTEMLLVLLLVVPMPSNQVRGAITGAVTSVWEKFPALRYIAVTLTVINAVYLWFVVDALLNPFRAHFGFYADDALSCELRAAAFMRERNAYISGFSLFLFLCVPHTAPHEKCRALRSFHARDLTRGKKSARAKKGPILF